MTSSATPHSSTIPTSLSPARIVDARSKCYKQLGELKYLNQAGILSDEECVTERQAIMDILKSIGRRK